jgi:hypothetical protein
MALPAPRADQLASKTGLVLSVTNHPRREILRRTPKWPIVACGFLVYAVVLLAIVYVWFIVAALAAAVGTKLARGAIRGWREHE